MKRKRSEKSFLHSRKTFAKYKSRKDRKEPFIHKYKSTETGLRLRLFLHDGDDDDDREESVRERA